MTMRESLKAYAARKTRAVRFEIGYQWYALKRRTLTLGINLGVWMFNRGVKSRALLRNQSDKSLEQEYYLRTWRKPFVKRLF